MHKAHFSILILIAISTLVLPGCTCHYVMQDLGTLPGGKESLASAVNLTSHIVGWSTTKSGATHAFLYRDGKMTDLGTLGGINSTAYGINDADVVVGSSLLTNGKTHAFRWTNGTLEDLSANPPPGVEIDFGVARAINNNGWIAGNGDLGAVIWKGTSSYESLQVPFQGPREANDINNLGQIAGSNRSIDQAFRWESGTFTLLPHLIPFDSRGLAINNAGQVVGWTYSTPPPPFHKQAVLFQANVPLFIGTLGGNESIAHAINDEGFIVGEADDKEGKRIPFVYNPKTKRMQALPTGGGSGVALAINENNIIVGCIKKSTGESHAILWKCVFW
jgi:probable HAF family extracellular repeat protein